MSLRVDTIYNEKEKVWYGPKAKPPLFHPDCSVGRVLFSMMKLKPEAIALQSDSEGTSFTYKQLLTDSIRIAQHLKKLEFSQDDIVGIISEHTMYFTHIFLASWFNGLCVHPVGPLHEQAAVTSIFGITRPKIFFCQGKYYNKVTTTCSELQLNALIYTIDEHIDGVAMLTDLLQPTGTEHLYIPAELEKGGEQTVYMANSSGSTGLPKSVCISNHSMFYSNRFDENDVLLNFSPLDWIGCILFSVNTLIVGAKRVISTKPCTPEYYLHLIEKYKVTNILIMPNLVAQLLNVDSVEQFDLSSLRRVNMGGSMATSKLCQDFRKLLKDEKKHEIGYRYGSTEMGGVCTSNYNIISKPGSVGKLVENLKVKIINENGELLGIGASGEVLVHKNKSWNGYYNNPEASLEMRDTEGWFHTGDLGYFDEDGYLFINDRIKNILKYRCYHYSPQEIEEVIGDLPDVVEVCVFGNTNETEGDRAAAAIVKRDGSKLTEAEVIQYVDNKFEVAWKRLSGGVFFFDSLPKTGSNKISRREVRDMALGHKMNGHISH